MSFQWDEAAARDRHRKYTETLLYLGNEQEGQAPDLVSNPLNCARMKLETWCWHDLKYAFHKIDSQAVEIIHLKRELEGVHLELNQAKNEIRRLRETANT